ncbi:low molecular weight protein-tyrosine-phosphatase [Lentilitoribacter sp. EG35]|jgi:protein-tyrosine phosphatase|uniref:low molecular weight protein-tyrosine-phosphatase n=1 Tax=Lentilitoribacter sp. EG35 TaxID=3234192 RepID=UPI003460D879
MKVLFICMGNICRSPMAEGLFRNLISNENLPDQIVVDSAGTGAWHEGDPPDGRAIAKMAQKGIDISKQVSRPLNELDFDYFDLLFVMDNDNLRNTKARAPDHHHHKIHLFMDYSLGENTDIPDPYYDLGDGFEVVYNMLLEACMSSLGKLKS